MNKYENAIQITPFDIPDHCFDHRNSTAITNKIGLGVTLSIAFCDAMELIGSEYREPIWRAIENTMRRRMDHANKVPGEFCQECYGFGSYKAVASSDGSTRLPAITCPKCNGKGLIEKTGPHLRKAFWPICDVCKNPVESLEIVNADAEKGLLVVHHYVVRCHGEQEKSLVGIWAAWELQMKGERLPNAFVKKTPTKIPIQTPGVNEGFWRAAEARAKQIRATLGIEEPQSQGNSSAPMTPENDNDFGGVGLGQYDCEHPLGKAVFHGPIAGIKAGAPPGPDGGIVPEAPSVQARATANGAKSSIIDAMQGEQTKYQKEFSEFVEKSLKRIKDSVSKLQDENYKITERVRPKLSDDQYRVLQQAGLDVDEDGRVVVAGEIKPRVTT